MPNASKSALSTPKGVSHWASRENYRIGRKSRRIDLCPKQNKNERIATNEDNPSTLFQCIQEETNGGMLTGWASSRDDLFDEFPHPQFKTIDNTERGSLSSKRIISMPSKHVAPLGVSTSNRLDPVPVCESKMRTIPIGTRMYRPSSL